MPNNREVLKEIERLENEIEKNLSAIFYKYSARRVTIDRRLAHLRGELNEAVRNYEIVCLHCKMVHKVNGWKMFGGRSLGQCIVISCPDCHNSYDLVGEDGERIKKILDCAYSPPKDLFG